MNSSRRQWLGHVGKITAASVALLSIPAYARPSAGSVVVIGGGFGGATASGDTTPPQRIIKTFKATLGGRPVIRANYYRSLSINPYLRFDMTPQQGGDMLFEWIEDTGRVVQRTETVRLG
ncbi:MAG TPA: thiosulfate oxidation carrier complex protein SoxZ [Eoetvoesiella sp.]